MTHPLTQAFVDLLKQGAYGYDSRTNSCSYITPKGDSCVVGLMLRPHMATKKLARVVGTSTTVMNGYSTSPDTLEAGRILNSLDVPARLIRDAQMLHDGLAARGAEFSIGNILQECELMPHLLPYVEEAYQIYQEQQA